MSNYVHGSADTTTQEETFDGFLRWIKRISILSISVLVFLAIFNS
ncbi:MAG: aa3-type cytochrome c oxidase subunit IV [Rhodobacteraceae bacterium]|nr:aa3-type cytochrome c oxidase subunit IV [Paracoccaceae bacterium]